MAASTARYTMNDQLIPNFRYGGCITAWEFPCNAEYVRPLFVVIAQKHWTRIDFHLI